MISPEQLAASDTEHGAQAAIFCWANQNLDKYPQLKYLFAVPNGFYGSAAQKGKMKAEGLKNGVPDIMLLYRKRALIAGINDGHHYELFSGLVIELKVKKNVPSKDQLDWLAFLKQQGYQCWICYGWLEARDKIVEYLER